jgi:hypothetical protein
MRGWNWQFLMRFWLLILRINFVSPLEARLSAVFVLGRMEQLCLCL